MQPVIIIPKEEQLIAYSTSPENEDKQDTKILGKKIKNDTDLMLWLSGKEINQKIDETKTVPVELNFKVKKKLRNKLIKIAKKCELYFIKHFPNKQYISKICPCCLKQIFDLNELLRFVNFEEFVYYLKYIFHLSDDVFSYSLVNFKNNKKEGDILFSKFTEKEELWNFDEPKFICKLCIFTLVNKPNFIENIKNVFLNNVNYNYLDVGNSELLDSNDVEEEIIQKKKGKLMNKNKLNSKNNNYECNIPNQINFNNSDIINININNSKMINNNYNNDTSYNNNKFFDFNPNINNANLLNITPEKIISYNTELFNINSKEIESVFIELKLHLVNLIGYISSNMKTNDNITNIQFIQNIQNQIILLFNKLALLVINNNYLLIVHSNYYQNNAIVIQILLSLINQNGYNYSRIEKIIMLFLFACNFLLNN